MRRLIAPLFLFDTYLSKKQYLSTSDTPSQGLQIDLFFATFYTPQSFEWRISCYLQRLLDMEK